MKNWATWIFIIAGLLYVVKYQYAAQPPVQLPSGRVELQQDRAVPYDDAALPPEPPKPLPTFGGYPCRTSDCAEDKAGYRWAEENGITNPDDCMGKTGAFIEGCRVYARQRGAEALDD